MELGFKHGWLQLAVDGTDDANGFDILGTERQPSRYQRIKAGSAFNKKLIPTYNIVVVLVVLIFTASHWLGKLNRVRRARRRKQYSAVRQIADDIPQLTRHSSGASTISLLDEDLNDDNASSASGFSSKAVTLNDPQARRPGKLGETDDVEAAALLDTQATLPSNPTFLSHLRALLLYQPRPIPLINRTLPDNATTLFVLVIWAINAFYSLYRCPLSLETIFVFADRTGYLFIANLPLLYFLAAKNQPLKFLTGYSYESLNIIHRRLGEILCLLAFLHTAGMFAVWYTVLRPTGWGLLFFLTRTLVLLGLLAFICYEALYFTSLASFRQRWYELFVVLHIILQASALPLLWFHHHRSKAYVGTAFATFAIDRLSFRMMLKSKHLPASLNVLKDNKTVLLTAQWPLPAKTWYRRLFGLTTSFKDGWKPTEHVFLTVPALSRVHGIQAHPFTIASPAPTAQDDQANLRLLIRAHNGFTRDLVEYAKYKSTVATIRLDGPYGSQTALSLLLDSDLAVVIAGGSGIAVGYPLVAGLLARRAQCKIEEDVEEDAAKGAVAEARICLIWIVHEEAHKSWLSQDDISELSAQGVSVLIPLPTAASGRPDVAKMFETWIATRLAVDDVSGRPKERVGVVCSGPEGMNRSVRNRCARLAAKGLNVGVEVEKYGW